MARLAILLHQGDPGKEQALLARLLDFLGVPSKSVSISSFSEVTIVSDELVVFGSAACIATALEHEGMIERCRERSTVFYAYSDPDRATAQRGIRHLLGYSCVKLRDASDGVVRVEVSSSSCADAGPMAGIRASLRMRKEDASLVGLEKVEDRIDAIISADGAPIFVTFHHAGIPIYLCASSYAIDIDQEIEGGYYDIKEHFCSAVPLLMFVRLMFKEVAWHPQEMGACLIIDDPLLQKRYGCCDFQQVRKLMQELGFSANIAFIPWNWWRTSRAAGDLFDKGSGPFSVSVHGCDHVKAEFGVSSSNLLYGRARLALERMRKHENRTGIHHEPVMVFPQGVFSSECPGILKKTGYIAAVNTEINSISASESRTRIRDAWDVAIMKYGDFGIFTRRYAHHGIENCAFDLLLGKPCLIASHHDVFKDERTESLELIKKLRSLNCALRWGPLGDVLSKACRRRVKGAGVDEVEMYGNELVINNTTEQEINVKVRKKERDADLVAEVRCGQKPIMWTNKNSHLVYEGKVGPYGEKRFQVIYREPNEDTTSDRSLLFEVSVAFRRILSEFRDDYLSRSRFLSSAAANMKNLLTKTN